MGGLENTLRWTEYKILISSIWAVPRVVAVVVLALYIHVLPIQETPLCKILCSIFASLMSKRMETSRVSAMNLWRL